MHKKVNLHPNPVGITNIGDPFIIRAKNGKYYMYATSFFKGFFVWVSEDLWSWSQPKICYEAGEDAFGYEDFWAPEVIEHNGKYIMHYSARWKKNSSLRIGVAVADQPEGPFIDVYDRPMFDLGYAAIDGNVFIDDDGSPYFYYSRDCSENVYEGRHESHIYVVKLSKDLLSIEGDPVLAARPNQEWEFISGDYRWNEGPFVFKRFNKYYMLYSSNFFASKDYSIGCAVAESPMGTFVKYDHPVLSYVEGKVSGPGHNSVFMIPDGTLYCAYHVHTHYDHPDGNRQLFIDEIVFEEEKLKILGPTHMECV